MIQIIGGLNIFKYFNTDYSKILDDYRNYRYSLFFI